jgi:hypothetical protein
MKQKDLLKAKLFLEAVVSGDLSVVREDACGICFNLDTKLTESSAYDFVKSNCSDWKHFSGNVTFPLPLECRYSDSMWKGKSLEFRQSLCKHLLTKLS